MLTFAIKTVMHNKYIYPIDDEQIMADSKETARILVNKLEALDINMTELNNRYLRAGHNIFSC